MGKVKVRVVGDEQQEQDALAEQKKKREEKAAAKKQAKGLNMGGGQRINAVGPTEEELMAEPQPTEAATEEKKETKKEKKARHAEVRTLSKRHTANASIVSKNTTYPISNGIEILRKFKNSTFDETVELHVNVKEKGVSGQVTLPYGTGKTLRIKVADDALISQIEGGKIDFDVLVATPDMMPKLAKVARVLGPKGLMPNPKNGTISDNPKAVIEKLSAGQVSYKTESAAPIIHMSVGKMSFDDKKLSENISTALTSIGAQKIVNVTLKSTMSPGIKLQV